MKSRITTYVLIVAVVAVWGFVAWKLFFSRPDVPVAAIAKPAGTGMKATKEEPLTLDYKDPFLKNSAIVELPEPMENAPVVQPQKLDKPSKPKQNPPIKYAGTIVKKGRVAHVFEHAGLLHSLAKGEDIEGYILTDIFADSVSFMKNEEQHVVYLQK